MNKGKTIQLAHLIAAAVISAAIIAGCATQPISGSGSSGKSSNEERSRDEGAGATSEELWVIAKPEPTGRATIVRDNRKDHALRETIVDTSAVLGAVFAASSDQQLLAPREPPGTGSMIARVDDPATSGLSREIPLPLKRTAVDARIDGYISTVNVEQQFQNPFSEKIEAIYLFPLPEKAAVSEFLMIIGDRRIRGIIREKEEAEKIYREARSHGYQASLLTQERPNIFEQKVANIEPGKAIDINIRYFHTLAYEDGWYSFVFPTVVGPRYNPPHHDDPVRAVPQGRSRYQGGDTAIEYLRPDTRSSHDLSIDVEIDAGVVIEDIQSTHQLVSSSPSPESASLQLANGTAIPNRDFIIKFKVAGQTVKTNLLTYVDPATNDGYFTMMLYPPENLQALERRPMEMVFVLDCSGSMSGQPLTQAKDAVLAALDMLQPNDTFQIIRFSDDSSQFGHEPVLATSHNLREARRYVNELNGTGGTQMIEGVKAALDFPHDPNRFRFVSFLTDGYIGNETYIIAAVHDRIGDSRIFSFGVGSSVNRYLLERMAKEGRGVVAYLGPQDSGRDIMGSFFERISHPAMTDIEVDWGGMVVTDVFPPVLPDLFVGRPVVVTGKYLGAASDIRVSGQVGMERHPITVSADESGEGNATISKIWARLRIADLGDRMAWSSDPYGELAAAIKNTALKYGLMSEYTSFVAVDASRRTDGEYGVTVVQPVPVPEGVRYDTTVNQD